MSRWNCFFLYDRPDIFAAFLMKFVSCELRHMQTRLECQIPALPLNWPNSLLPCQWYLKDLLGTWVL